MAWKPAHPTALNNFFKDDSSAPTIATASEDEPSAKKQLPIEPIPLKAADSFKHTEEPIQSAYTQSKPISHSPKISPSSIPNPNPSIIPTKQESSYSTVGGYPFSIPGYSAFQPVSHPTVTQSISSSLQPVSSNTVKCQSEYIPYSNISSDPLASAVPISGPSMSPAQGSILTSIESSASIPLTSTFSASPITTIASMRSASQITPVCSSVPPVSIALEPLPPPTLQPKSVEPMKSTSLERSSPSMLRMSAGHSTASNLPTASNTLELSLEDPTPLRKLPSKSPIHREQSEQSHIPSDIPDIPMQRTQEQVSTLATISPDTSLPQMPVEHSIRPLSTLSSDSSTAVVTSTKLPSASSIQRTMATIPMTIPISSEHVTQPNMSVDSSMARDMSSMPVPSELMQRMPLDHPQSTIPTESSIKRSLASVTESTRQHIPLEHSMPSIPNMPPDSQMQRMPLEYYMQPLPMMPPELLMRRMQLLQYMQSLQTMTTESSIALIPHVQQYVTMPQPQSTATVHTTLLDQPITVTSTTPLGHTVSHTQPMSTTSSLVSQTMAPVQMMIEGKPLSLMSSNTSESVTGIVTHAVKVDQTSSISSIPQVQPTSSMPLETIPQSSAISSTQSTLSMVQLQTAQTSSNNLYASKPPLSLVQTTPLLSVMASDYPLKSTSRMQIVQSVPYKPSILSSESVMFGLPSGQVMPLMSTKASEPSMTSISQMQVGTSMPYESVKSSDASLQLEQSMEPISKLTTVPLGVSQSMPVGLSTEKSMKTDLQPLQSISVPELSISSTSSENMTLSYMQASMASDSTIERMNFARTLQPLESDKFMLYTQASIRSEPSMLQESLAKSVESVSFTPSKLSTASVPYGHTKLRMNLVQPIPSISSITSVSPLSSISHVPFTQSVPQLSMIPSNPSVESLQRVQLQNIPFMSVRSEHNPTITNELIQPLSLVQSMSSMTLAPSLTSKQSTTLIDSVAPESDSLKSGQVLYANNSEIATSHAPLLSTSLLLHSDENNKRNYVLSELPDKCLESSHAQFGKHIDDHFTSDSNLTGTTTQDIETKSSSLSERSHDVTKEIPTQTISKETKRKPLERFSLKTSIPISKIDIKSVPNPPDIAYHNPLGKKLAFNALKVNNGSRVEKQIQRNVLIRGAEPESDEYQSMVPSPHNNLTTLVNAADAVNANDKFRKPDPKVEIKETNPINKTSRTAVSSKKESSKLGFKSSSSDISVSDQNNQIVVIQNKSCTSKKMILTIQQQNPQVLLKRKNIEKSSLRFSGQLKKRKEESVTITEHIPSKVVALKRLHQGDCDEDDFENLITENQIYGNKIVVKEKIQGTSQEQDFKLKNNKMNRSIHSETKSVVKPPNFVYLSNVKYPSNIMMYKNNLKANTDFNKDSKITVNENKISEVNYTATKASDRKLQNVPISKENQLLNTGNNLLQVTSNKNNKTDTITPKTHQKVLMPPKTFQQVPKIIETGNKIVEPAVSSALIVQNINKVLPKPLEQNKVIDTIVSTTYRLVESSSQSNTSITDNLSNTTQVEEEISSLDVYEKRRKLRRVKYILNRGVKDVQKSEAKKPPSDGGYTITPEQIKAEIYEEFASTRIFIEDDDEMESEYEDESEEYESLIKTFGPNEKGDRGKTEFLLNFMLGTQDTCKEILWNKRERIIRRDKVASAYIAAGRLDRLMNDDNPNEIPAQPNSIYSIPINNGNLNEIGFNFQRKQMFLAQLRLKYVKPHHRAGYESTWQEILKERRRRDAPERSEHVFKHPRTLLEKVQINTNTELLLLHEIKNSVTENNNLIKKRLDLSCQGEGESIKSLAEKNFSELNRLSKMADRSVKHFSGQDTRKRDLNPGFDSANIQVPLSKLDPPINYPNINIPNISKIISLKTTLEPCSVTSTQATSMDEPQNSAAGVEEMFREANIDKTKAVECQTEKEAWPGVEEVTKMYREFEKARKKEMVELTRRNTALKVKGAHITRNASRHSDRARALLAERRNLSLEEAAIKQAIQRLFNAVDVVRNYF